MGLTSLRLNRERAAAAKAAAPRPPPAPPPLTVDGLRAENRLLRARVAELEAQMAELEEAATAPAVPQPRRKRRG